MKRLSITIVVILMVMAMAGIKSSGIFANDGPGSNSGTTQSAPASVKAPSANPPHGQPGHQCDHGQPGHVCSAPSGQPPNLPQGTGSKQPTATPLNIPAQTTTDSTAPGMNPPHGQPNHRCDIGVGVPLDSPPGTGKSNSLSPTPIQINPATGASSAPVTNPTQAASLTAPGSVTAPGMNPPHGQPNHRCDIGVGVPLDSPAGTGKTSPSTSQLNIPGQTTTSPMIAPGMNPPHGQPNHRCDIGVGVPLDSPAGTGKTPPATGASSSTNHVHNKADSLNSPPIRIVPTPPSGATGK